MVSILPANCLKWVPMFVKKLKAPTRLQPKVVIFNEGTKQCDKRVLCTWSPKCTSSFKQI